MPSLGSWPACAQVGSQRGLTSTTPKPLNGCHFWVNCRGYIPVQTQLTPDHAMDTIMGTI